MAVEQVSQKRAVDRSNQRNHRAKNKAYIRHLEDKVAELTYKLERAQTRLLRYESRSDKGGTGGYAPSPVLSHEEFSTPQDCDKPLPSECYNAGISSSGSLEEQDMDQSGPNLPNDCSTLPLVMSRGWS